MKKAIDYFYEFVQENGRYPDLEEFKGWGYSRASYYRSKNDYGAYLIEKKKKKEAVDNE